jgi:hypothetical protein
MTTNIEKIAEALGAIVASSQSWLRGRESMIIPGKRRLSAESFRALGIALFGEDWEAIMAQELNVDRSIVGSWATQGPPSDHADALRNIAGYRRSTHPGCHGFSRGNKQTPPVSGVSVKGIDGRPPKGKHQLCRPTS